MLWETTKACPLACVHCRATATPHALPGQLTTEEGERLVDDLASGGRPRPVLVLTGGDCLARDDLVTLVARARSRGVPVAIAPAVSPRLAPGLLTALHDHGVRHASLSLDGATAATHEAVRQVPGHFGATVDAVRLLASLGFTVQVNTAVMASNVAELAGIAALLRKLGVRIWEVFFLVNVGRGGDVADIGPPEAEDVCNFLVDVARRGIVVRTVEAPFFRRVQHERASAGGDVAPAGAGRLYHDLAAELSAALGPPVAPVLAPTSGTRDGKGVVFVSHDGQVHPSGFLPVPLGNVRDGGLLDIYRSHPLLRAIRSGRFPGRCGACEHRDLCGGSRARAFSATGDPLGDDPACVRVDAGRHPDRGVPV